MWLNVIEYMYAVTIGLHMMVFMMLYKEFYARYISMYM